MLYFRVVRKVKKYSEAEPANIRCLQNNKKSSTKGKVPSVGLMIIYFSLLIYGDLL